MIFFPISISNCSPFRDEFPVFSTPANPVSCDFAPFLCEAPERCLRLEKVIQEPLLRNSIQGVEGVRMIESSAAGRLDPFRSQFMHVEWAQPLYLKPDLQTIIGNFDFTEFVGFCLDFVPAILV